MGAVIGAVVPVVIVAFVGFAIFRVVRARKAAKAAAGRPAALPAAQSQQREAGGPVQGDTVWHDGQQCTVQYVNSKGLLDLRNQGGAVFYGVAKVELSPPGPTAGYPQAAQPPVMMGQVVS